jgi:hypothetical protein
VNPRITRERFGAYLISQSAGQFYVHGFATLAAAKQPPIGELVARTQTLEGARAVLPEGWHIAEGVTENMELWVP